MRHFGCTVLAYVSGNTAPAPASARTCPAERMVAPVVMMSSKSSIRQPLGTCTASRHRQYWLLSGGWFPWFSVLRRLSDGASAAPESRGWLPSAGRSPHTGQTHAGHNRRRNGAHRSGSSLSVFLSAEAAPDLLPCSVQYDRTGYSCTFVCRQGAVFPLPGPDLTHSTMYAPARYGPREIYAGETDPHCRTGRRTPDSRSRHREGTLLPPAWRDIRGRDRPAGYPAAVQSSREDSAFLR